MSKTPSKIGIIVSSGAFWEIIYCFYHIEKSGYLRQPITVQNDDEVDIQNKIELNLSKHSIEHINNIKATGINGLIIHSGVELFNSLCDFENAGNALKIDNSLKGLIKGMYRLEKPIGAFGEASLLVAKSLQGITKAGPVVTVGNDPKLQDGIGSTGAQAVVTRPGEVVLDEENKIVSSGGEFNTKRPVEVFGACDNLMKGIDEFIKGRKHEKY